MTSDILENITRQTIIDLYRDELGLTVVEREIDRTEVYIANEAFFCGSGAEVTPMLSLDHYALETGKETKRIQTLYFEVKPESEKSIGTGSHRSMGRATITPDESQFTCR